MRHERAAPPWKGLALLPLLIGLLVPGVARTGDQPAEILAPGLFFKDALTIVGGKSFLADFPAVNADGTVNVVIEIPAGTNAKWEVDPKTGAVAWEIKDGKPRVVQYLAYPANYGMVPKTLGGDMDTLDALVLGSAIPRGSVVSVRVIGALKLLDGGERDDKLITVRPGSLFGDLSSLAELDQRYPGVTAILENWFVNYKGRGKMVSEGLLDAGGAKGVLEEAIRAFK